MQQRCESVALSGRLAAKRDCRAAGAWSQPWTTSSAAFDGRLVAFLPGGRTRPAAGTLDWETNSCFPPAALRAAQRGHKSGHPRAGVHADGGLADGSVVLSRARLAGIKARPSRRAKGQRTGIGKAFASEKCAGLVASGTFFSSARGGRCIVRRMQKIVNQDPGFITSNLMMMSISPSIQGYSE